MNKAAQKGPESFSWWPDWRGECVAIVACGPSVKGLDLASLLRDRIHVIAIKTSVDLCPWADVCYGCDAAWWVDRKGLPAFKGARIFHGVQAKQFQGMHRVEIVMGSDNLLVEQPLKIGNGGNSGFQALNLAVQFGATDIVLVGYDCHGRGDLHWYGRNKWLNASNPAASNFNRWRTGFEAARKDVDKLGVTVVNASVESEVQSFRKAPLPDVLMEWGL